MRAGNGQGGELFTPCASPPGSRAEERRLEERRGAKRRRWGVRGGDQRVPDVLQQICLPLLPGLKDAQLLQKAKLYLLGRLHL